MDKTPPAIASEEVLNLIRQLRADVTRHEQQIEMMLLRLNHLSGSAIKHIPTSENIRKVEAHQTNAQDIASKLRATWLGRLYKKHLKQYGVIRYIVQWIWRNGYPVYVNHIATRLHHGKAKRWLPLAKLGEYSKKNGIPTYKLADATLVETPEPKVFPTCDRGYLVTPHEKYQFPEIFVATINNAITYGGTNLILAGGEVVCHDLYDFDLDYTSEELHGRTLVDPKFKRIRWLLHDEAPEPISVAATFVDACAPNYAHWLTEVLPRIALFCAEAKFYGVPIVVNDGLHKNIMESLFLVAGTEREIITLPVGRALAVNRLYLTSVTGYVPFEPRSPKFAVRSHGRFSAWAFNALRDRFVPTRQEVQAGWPEKIYVRRNSGARRVINGVEVEKLLVSFGYVIVEPEKLSFSDQVQLFRNAKVVVASTGAALANIIFSPADAKIYILIFKYPHANYWYWQNIACASGNKVIYLFGEVNALDPSGIHADFRIELQNLLLEEDFSL